MGRATAYRYRRFAVEFFKDCDACAAYQRAGFKAKSPGAIRANSSKLLASASMKPYLAEEFACLQARLDLQQDRLVIETCRLAYSDMLDVCSWGPRGVDLKDSAMLPADVTAAIQEVRCVTKTRTRDTDNGPVEETETRVKVKLHPKIPALKMLHDLFQKGSAYAPIEEVHLQAFVAIIVKYVPVDQKYAFMAEVEPFLEALASGYTEALPSPAQP